MKPVKYRPPPVRPTVVHASCTFLLILAFATAPGAAPAAELDISGSFSTELRYFPQGPAFPGQSDTGATLSFSVTPKFQYEWNGAADRLTFEPFLRLDSADKNRSHADIRALNWLHRGETWDLVVGIDKVFWGVAESRHLVDIVNQTDAVEDVDGEAKLGQPMVNLNLQGAWGRLGFFILPGFRERTFPADDARLRGPLPIASDSVTFDAGAGGGNVDYALRYSRSFGKWDLGLSYFHGTSREPRLLPGVGPDAQPVLVPHYDLIEQTGLDLQYTTGAWLSKLEAITRTGHGDRFHAAVAGFEYTKFGFNGSNADLGFLAEYSYDGRDPVLAPPTAYDNDLFLGLRLSLNDINDSYAVAGALVDTETHAIGLFLEADRRIGETWRVDLKTRFFFDTPADDPLQAIERDGFLGLSVSKFF